MRKRLLALLLALLMIGSVLPVTAAAETEGPDYLALVTEQYNAFAASMMTDEQAISKAALTQMIDRATTKEDTGDLIMDEDDPMTATVLNSALYQQTIVQALAKAVERMNGFSQDRMYLRGSLGWYDHGFTHHLRIYDDFLNDNDDDDRPYGSILSVSKFLGRTNMLDDALMLVAGSAFSRVVLEEVRTTQNSRVFRVELRIMDTFDFNGDYSKFEGDTSFAELLTKLGQYLELNEFFWSVTADFELEIPFSCDHSAANYHWTYDGTEMISSDADGFTENPANRIDFLYNEKNHIYYELEETVRLFHDKPWTVEFVCKGSSTLVLSPTENINSGYPFLARTQTWRDNGTCERYVFGGEQFYRLLTKLEQELMGTTSSIMSYRSYYGLDYSEVYRGSVAQLFRLENRIAEDGSNMIWLTIDGEEMGPLMDHYLTYSDVYTELQEDPSDWVSGKDFYINYIGNQNWPVSSVIKSVSIWENGKDSDDPHYGVGTVTEPTCMEGGYTTYLCPFCDAVYTAEETEPVSHAYAEPVFTWQKNLGVSVSTGDCLQCQAPGLENGTCAVTAAQTAPGTMTLTAKASDGAGWTAAESETITVVKADGRLSLQSALDLSDLTIWAASYGPGGQLQALQPASEARMDGNVRLFFLDPLTWTPRLPQLHLPWDGE